MAKEKPATKICKHCKTEIPYEAKVCPQCRKKQGGGCLSKIVIAIAVLVIIGMLGSGGGAELSEDAQNMTKKEYKAACEKVTYEDLARTPEEYVGKKIKIVGKIQQVVNDSDTGTSAYLIPITKDEYGFYNDSVYVELLPDNKQGKFLEDDVVTIHGEANGEYTYKSVLGQSITVPKVTAVYMSLKKEKSE